MEDLQAISSAVTEEIRRAAAGEKTSFPFLRNRLPEHSLVTPGEAFQVLVIGGSVGKTALLRKEARGVTLLKTSVAQLPLFQTADVFYDFAASQINPDVHHIALNFAYPLKPRFRAGRLDGILVAGMKEHAFTGLVGRPIGEALEERFPNHHVTSANDTICLLLAGLGQGEDIDPESLACGVVGTGVNFAYFETPTEAINLEAANFTTFPRNEEDRLVDEASLRPGTAWFEKATSGAYLHQHFNLRMRKLGLSFPQLTSTEALDEVLTGADSEAALVARSLLNRSAALIASQIAGITNYKQRAMTFLLEGSLFWKGSGYQQGVEERVRSLAPTHQVTFVHLPDSPILGAAQLLARA